MPEKLSREYFRKGFKSWKREFSENKYLILLSLIVIVIAGLVDYYSGLYVSSAKVTAVPDLILDHVRPVNLSFVFVYLYIFTILILFLYPLIFHIRKLNVVLNQFGLLVILRSVFIIFTHLKTPLDAVPISFPWIFKGLSFQNDLFFSGHTAVPFLGFLLFRESKIRYMFLAISVILGISVLLMHRHYSIDVFSAFFITYCSYKIANFLLRKIKSS